MDRRTLFIGAATGLAAGVSGTWVLTTAFAPNVTLDRNPKKVQPENAASGSAAWPYSKLDEDAVAALAHQLYPDGGCMYSVFGSMIKSLASLHGEPYASFPVHMMKYGASGIGGYGSVCGALNGAAAALGLFIENKSHQEAIVHDLFYWYEKESFPKFTPGESAPAIAASVSHSVLCHASTANWTKASGCRIDSKERSERCSRLSADVAQKTVRALNAYFDGGFITSESESDTVATCVTCHGKTGKIANIKGKMECTSCHEESIGHQLFADVHYQLMKE